MRITIETDERSGATVQAPGQTPGAPGTADALPAGAPPEALLRELGASTVPGTARHEGAIDAGPPAPELVAVIESARAAVLAAAAVGDATASTGGAADGGPAPAE